MNWKLVFAGLAVAIMSPGPRAEDVAKVGLANLDEIQAFPSAYLQVPFQLEVLFNGTGEVYNPFYTVFEPSGWYNFSAWGAHSAVWKRDQYRKPHRYFYVERSNEQTYRALSGIRQRTWLRLTCKVRSTFKDDPWIEVLSVDNVGSTLDRKTLSKLVRGWTLAEQGDWERAAVELETANLAGMPRPFVALQRVEYARCALRSGDNHAARTALAQARSLDRTVKGAESLTASLDNAQNQAALADAPEQRTGAAAGSTQTPSVLIPFRDLGSPKDPEVTAPTTQPAETVEWTPSSVPQPKPTPVEAPPLVEVESATDASALEDWTAPPSGGAPEIAIEFPGNDPKSAAKVDAANPVDGTDAATTESVSGTVTGQMTILENSAPETVLEIDWPSLLEEQASEDSSGFDESSSSAVESSWKLPTDPAPKAAKSDETMDSETVTSEVEVPAIAGLEPPAEGDTQILEMVQLPPLPFENESSSKSVASLEKSGSESAETAKQPENATQEASKATEQDEAEDESTDSPVADTVPPPVPGSTPVPPSKVAPGTAKPESSATGVSPPEVPVKEKSSEADRTGAKNETEQSGDQAQPPEKGEGS